MIAVHTAATPKDHKVTAALVEFGLSSCTQLPVGALECQISGMAR